MKTAIEEQLGITPSSLTYNLGRTSTRESLGSSSVHLPQQEGITTTPGGGIRHRPSLDWGTPNSTTPGRKLSVSRRGPSFDSPRPSPTAALHKRASFALLQTLPGSAARRVSTDDGGGRPVVAEDEFDALVASGETLKVSLTPGRLKKFDVRQGVAVNLWVCLINEGFIFAGDSRYRRNRWTG